MSREMNELINSNFRIWLKNMESVFGPDIRKDLILERAFEGASIPLLKRINGYTALVDNQMSIISNQAKEIEALKTDLVWALNAAQKGNELISVNREEILEKQATSEFIKNLRKNLGLSDEVKNVRH